MHGTQELAATVATSFLRVTLVPIIDLDVIQFAAETVTAATSALAPDPCRSLTPTRRRKTSAPHPSGGGHLRELTICAGTSTWTPVNIVSNCFCAAANAAVDSRVAAESGTVGASLCARSGSSRRLALMRSIVACSRSRCSAFSSSSEPGCLWLLVVAAAPAAPVGHITDRKSLSRRYSAVLRVYTWPTRACCCWGGRAFAIARTRQCLVAHAVRLTLRGRATHEYSQERIHSA